MGSSHYIHLNDPSVDISFSKQDSNVINLRFYENNQNHHLSIFIRKDDAFMRVLETLSSKLYTQHLKSCIDCNKSFWATHGNTKSCGCTTRQARHIRKYKQVKKMASIKKH
jgi:hypothetical protein